MSKIDDLMAAFKTGFRDRLQGPGIRPEGDIAIRAGIIAVIRALRDEFREEYGMWERFTEILGDGPPAYSLHAECAPSDRGQVAGGVTSRQTESGRPATDHINDANKMVPETCEWTQGKDGWLVAACRAQYGLSPFYYKPKGCCKFCGLPIKFKEKS